MKRRRPSFKTALTYSKAGKESEGPRLLQSEWVPWLCAFTGARVTKITAPGRKALRRSTASCRKDHGHEDGEYRDVPLHPQLVEIGFLKFVEAASPWTALLQ